MLKNISKLECKVNERSFTFLADTDSPLAEVKEALFQFVKFVGNLEEKAQSSQSTESKGDSSDQSIKQESEPAQQE